MVNYTRDALMERIGRIKTICYSGLMKGEEPRNYELAKRALDITKTLSPLEVKSEMHGSLSYETTAQNIALKRAQEKINQERKSKFILELHRESKLYNLITSTI